MEKAPRRCKWRARRIAWCRKFAKFCNPPIDYETCPGYEPVQYETVGLIPPRKIRRNLELLRSQFSPVEIKRSPQVPSRVELCKRLVDGIDTPRVAMYEALDRLDFTGNYEWAKSYLEGRLDFGRAIAKRYAGALGPFGESFMKFYDEQIVPLLRSLVESYEKRKELTEIEEQTLAVDRKLYEWMFDKFKECVGSSFPQETKGSEEIRWSRVQIPPGTDMLYRYVMQPNIEGKYSSSMSLTLELKERFSPELKQMITEAEREKREIGAMICRTTTGEPHLSRACYGRRETVTVADCHDGLNPLGSFHVHLGGTDVFSVPDLELAIKKEQLSCLGYTKDAHPYLKCINPKRFYELPYETRASIKQSLDKARQDIERAKELYRSSPSEAQLLSQRAQATLRNVEQLLAAQEVEL